MISKLWSALPTGYRQWLHTQLGYAGISIAPMHYFAACFFVVSLFLATACLLYTVGFWQLCISTAALALLIAACMHAWLSLEADRRASFVEEVLPDMLHILSANLRSGLTIDKALLLSARPEFGPFEAEIRKAAHHTMAGESVEQALERLTKSYRSKSLRRAMELLEDGLRRGANLPEMLDGLAAEIREIRTLRKEVVAHVMLYMFFIFFAAAIAAPVLYAIASFLIHTMSQIGTRVSIPELPGEMPVQLGIARIEPSMLEMYALIAMGLTSTFAGLLIGTVKEGSERGGIKLIPLLLVLSILVYYGVKQVVTMVLGITI